MWTTANSMSARALVAVARTTTSHSGFNSNYYYYGAGCGVVGVRTVGGMAAQVSAPTIPPAKSASPTNHPSAYGRDPEDFRRMNRTREESLVSIILIFVIMDGCCTLVDLCLLRFWL